MTSEKTSAQHRAAVVIGTTAGLIGWLALVELTSGNTGTGLAIVCAALGHPFVAVISRGNSIGVKPRISRAAWIPVIAPQAAAST